MILQKLENSDSAQGENVPLELLVSLADSTEMRLVPRPFSENYAKNASGAATKRKTVRGQPTFNVQPAKPKKKDHVVYFVEAENGLIKIGTTGDIEWRMKSLGTMSPIPLKLLATTKGRRTEEFAYHARFAHARLHGEWFSRCPELEAEIERLSAGEVGG